MSEHKETVKIYLNDPAVKEQVLSEASASEKFIIVMNDILQTENREHIARIEEMKSRELELESELDRAELSNSSLKGLLKNFHEMDKNRRAVSDIESKMLSSTRGYVRAYKNRARYHVSILHCILAVFIALCYDNYDVLHCLPILGMVVVVAAFQESMLANLSIPLFKSDEKHLGTIKSEIKNTIKAQDYIHEYLDNQ